MNASADQAAIRGIVAALHKGLHDRDAAAITAHYEPDAAIFDLAPPLSHTVDRAGLAAWLGTWQGPVEREAKELGLTTSGDLAVWHGYFHTSATTPGGENAAWWERATIVFRRAGDGWKIVQEHTSVPFRMDGSFLAATDLTP
jgi:ketosteroid isomerase-like protein